MPKNSADSAAVLINLGSPAAPTVPAVRAYLREFLGDPHVLTLPFPLRKLLLECVILPRRPKKSAERYAKIWTPAGAPLIAETEKLRSRVNRILAEKFSGESVAAPRVLAAMRYGEPSLKKAARELAAAGTQRVFAIPLYPQRAESSWDTAVACAKKAFKKFAPQIELKFAEPFFAAPRYIEALAGTVRRALADKNFDKLLLSFHGVPVATAGAARYREQCAATTEALVAALKIPRERCELVFQSHFGPGKWLEPATAARLRALPSEGARRVAIAAPGFTADCLETLEELAVVGKTEFLSAGGEEFFFIPCLNDDPAFAEFLAAEIRAHL